MPVEMRTLTAGGTRIVYDARRFSEPVERWFDPELLEEADSVHAEAEGRGGALRFRCDDSEYVLRRYRRGGRIAPVLRDRYLRTPLEAPRPVREANLLLLLRGFGLPVPEPVAWRVRSAGLFYRADLITVYLPSTTALGTHLAQTPIRADAWRRLGAMLRTFHDRQVWHADLSLGNILLDADGRFYLIDFDRARIRRGSHWKEQNLQRLLRSCRKRAREVVGFRFREEDFRALREGYCESTP